MLDTSVNDKSASNATSPTILAELVHDTFGLALHGRSDKYSKAETVVTELVAAVPLFAGGRWAIAGSALVTSLNSAKAGDTTENQIRDLTLGAIKGAGTKATFNLFGSKDWNFAARGVAMGVSSRFLDTALTAQTYLDESGNATAKSLGSGLVKSVTSNLAPSALATDILVVGAGTGALKVIGKTASGAIERSPMAASALTGSIFGFTSGALSEIQNQRATGSFKPGSVLTNALEEAALMSVASMGGTKLTPKSARPFLKIDSKQEAQEPQISSSPERFNMPLIYPADKAYAHTMQNSVAHGVDYLRGNPQSNFTGLMDVLINNARPGLKQRAESFVGTEQATVNIKNHADEFGLLRGGGQRVTWIGDRGPLSAYLGEATQVLKTFGTHKPIQETWGQFSKRYGQPFIKEQYVLEHSYQTPDGKVPLSTVHSYWIPTHEEAYVRKPFGEITITSPKVSSIQSMFKAGDEVLQKAKLLKQQIDSRELPKNDATLKKVTDLATETYWMASQNWPYQRGSAGIADMASKTMFDWFGVHTPSWKGDVNPNMVALLSPLGRFQERYPTLMDGHLRWQ